MSCEFVTSGNCSVFGEFFSAEEERGSHLRIFIEGPQGSGKTTLAQHLSSLMTTSFLRGFPTSSEILSASAQSELCRRSLEMSVVPDNEILVFDRSPLSQFAFLFRQTNDSKYLSCAKRALSFLSCQFPIAVIFIESETSACFSREDSQSVLNNSSWEIVDREVSAYQFICEYLRRVSIPGVLVVSVRNGQTTKMSDFLAQGEELVKKLLIIVNPISNE